MTTYTVYDPNSGDVLGRGMNALDAMDEILLDDGYRYEIRRELHEGNVHWILYRSTGSAASPIGAAEMQPTLIGSVADDEGAAHQEIAAQVIAAHWQRGPDVMTDEDFDRRLAQAADDD